MNYKKARDIAWKVLIENDIRNLPINIPQICKKEGIQLFTYSVGKNMIKALDLERHSVDNDAFSLGNLIFYDDSKPEQRQRFSIAHELGHIFLHTPIKATTYNREPSPNDDPLETEANIFASRLLAPLCVLQFLNLNSIQEISEHCNVSFSAAKLRFERLCQIRRRNSERLKDKHHGTFLLSELERQVIANFEEFINLHKK